MVAVLKTVAILLAVTLGATDAIRMRTVPVVKDAVYSVPVSRGPACGGSGDAPTGHVCPRKGDMAIRGCDPSLKSYNSKKKRCKAPSNAVCAKFNKKVWRCIFAESVTPAMTVPTPPKATTTPPSSTTAAPSATTAIPSATTAAPSLTTGAPSSTTAAPSSTTATPISTTAVPSSTTTAPISTTAMPISTTATPAVDVETDPKSGCSPDGPNKLDDKEWYSADAKLHDDITSFRQCCLLCYLAGDCRKFTFYDGSATGHPQCYLADGDAVLMGAPLIGFSAGSFA